VRIPRPARMVLRALPPRAAAPLLLRAIGGHAWTFAGSGTFTAEAGHPVRVRIAGGPICRGTTAEAPVCAYYAATFETLFRALVSGATTVRETACEACGADACTFEMTWR